MGHPLGAAGSRTPSPPAPQGPLSFFPKRSHKCKSLQPQKISFQAIFPQEASASVEGGETCHPHASVYGLSLFALVNSKLLNL